jgi:TonB family protein
VATRIVQPKFPPFAKHATGRIEASFAIAADGSVTDIRFVEGDPDSAYARAAERALKQWRFATAGLADGQSARYTQTFVFAPSKESTAGGCFKPTGSLVCREPEDTTSATSHTPRR